MARLAARLAALVLIAILALLWAQRDRQSAAPGDPEAIAIQDPPESILAAIEKLESETDATCQSNANRFEDFLYGTPLTDEARGVNVEFQKRWLQRVWADASSAAARDGEAAVSPQRLREQIAQWFDWSETADGQIEARFVDHAPLTIPKWRAERYGSIAYSLRAILAVEQDRIVSSVDASLTLAPAAIEVLRESNDIATLSALTIAEQKSRESNEPEITDATLREAWNAVLPGMSDTAAPATKASLTADRETRTRSLELLEELIAGKIAAHRAYNGFDDHAASDTLLRTVVARYFARAPIPTRNRGWTDLLSRFNGHLNEFSVDLLLEANADAASADHELIRAVDASRAVQRLIPHGLDDFGDVQLFPRLASADRITLDAYDCDSFRDFGLHWPPLQRAIRVLPQDARLPDPFAAEIIAEAISQFGVLLLRVAGDIAKQGTDNVRLQPESLASGVALIADRAVQHRDAPDLPESPTGLASVVGTDATKLRDRWFDDATASSGVDYRHRSSSWLEELRRKSAQTAPTFSGGGVAAEDLDGDADMDLLFVGGNGNALYINDGHGRFHDVTEQAGIDFRGPDGSYEEARNPLIVDFDNDGLQDILITYVDADHRLYRNLGDLRFEDVSRGSGLLGEGMVAGPATVFDFDGDGLLDLYVGHLGDYLNGVLPTEKRDTQNGSPNKLYRNLGGMRFADVTAGSGTDDSGWTQAVSHTDFDRDGRQDIIVANDFGRNAFLRNLGGGRFENTAPSLGVTNAFHSMNVGISDINDDGHPDIYISNMASLVKDDRFIFPDVSTSIRLDLRAMEGVKVKESDVLYLSKLEAGRLVGYEPSENVERGATSTGWAWDAEFFDFDCDGDDDLYLANGTNDYHVYAAIYNDVDPDGRRIQHLLNHTREPNVFFVNDGGRLKNESARSGADSSVNSRSTAYLDFDADGDLDIAVNNFHAPALILRNNAEQRDLHWLKLRLIGDPSRGSNRDAIGARIVVTTEDRLRVTREVQGGSGYLSMNPKQQHFGLGRSRSADAQIIWPNGEQQHLEDLAANRSYTVRQSEQARQDSH